MILEITFSILLAKGAKMRFWLWKFLKHDTSANTQCIRPWDFYLNLFIFIFRIDFWVKPIAAHSQTQLNL